MNRLRMTRLRRLVRLAMTGVVLLGLTVAVSPALAQEPPGVESELEGDAELGVQSPTQYWEPRPYDCTCHAAAGGSLTNHAYHEAWGTCTVLDNCNWIKRHIWNKYYAWEQDFKRAARGGTENSNLDEVDLQFYVGHGNPGTFTFWNDNHDDCCLVPDDCYRSWGDRDNEYVALTSCSVLGGTTSQLRAWANCGLGTHLILGFKTGAAARYPYYRTTGYWFARYLCAGYTVVQAWDKAADRAQPTGRVVRTLINELTYMNERPAYGYVRTYDSTDWDWWVHTHTAGSEPARYVDAAALDYEMPRFRFAPFTLAEARYEELGDVFNVEATPPASIQQNGDGPTAMWSDTTGGRELEMDSGSGLYGYTDLDNLWTYTTTRQAYLLGASITADQAKDIADQFLKDNGLMPGDAQYYETVEDTISGGEVITGSVASLQASWLAEQPMAYQVIYSRILTYTPTTAAGVNQQPQVFSVVGPGAKLKVYVPSSAATISALSANDEPPVMGVLGGWRTIEGQGQGGWIQSTMETVPILTEDEIYTLHDELRDMVVLDPLPFEFDEMEILTHTVTYWEEGAGSSQSESTPIYELTVRFMLEDEEVGVDMEHIAASEEYMPPFARIESYPKEMVETGQSVTLTATEAATSLYDLGYPANLDFILGSGQPEDYTYEWFLGSVDAANQIGAGRSITYTVSPAVTMRAGGAQQTIILRVTDINNPDVTSNTDLVTIDIYPRILLPLILRSQ